MNVSDLSVGQRVVWMRRRRGRCRRVVPIPVRVVGQTQAGRVIVEHERRYRVFTEAVDVRNLAAA